MTKSTRKAIMIDGNSKANIKKTEAKKICVKCQRNFCGNLLRQTRIRYLDNLNVKDLTNNKRFCKIVRSLSTEKVVTTFS